MGDGRSKLGRARQHGRGRGSTDGFAPDPEARVRRRWGAVLVASALVLAACTNGSDDRGGAPSGEGPGTPTADESSSFGPNQTGGEDIEDVATGIAFVVPDGAAALGTRPVVLVTNTETDESFSVPVLISGDDARVELAADPGTYAIAAEPTIGPGGVVSVQSITPAEITVPEPGDAGAIQEVALAVEHTPTPLLVGAPDVRATEVHLGWSGVAGGSGVVVRRTDGRTPASGPDDGTEVPLPDPTALAITVTDLAPGTEYTFTVFAPDAPDAPSGSVTVTTSDPESGQPSIALEPNTVVATDLDALDPQLLSDGRVQVTLSEDHADQASAHDVPGVDVPAGGSVVGAPFLVDYAVAGDDAFFGIVEACPTDGTDRPASLRKGAALAGPSLTGTRRAPAQAGEAAGAVVNTDVPLSAVFSHLGIDSPLTSTCYDLGGSEAKVEDTSSCDDGTDTDGDGLTDAEEAAHFTDAGAKDTDGDGLTDGAEVKEHRTDPKHRDTDLDALTDGSGPQSEAAAGTDPLKADTDDDGCGDWLEWVTGGKPLDPAKHNCPPGATAMITRAVQGSEPMGPPTPSADELLTAGTDEVIPRPPAAGDGQVAPLIDLFEDGAAAGAAEPGSATSVPNLLRPGIRSSAAIVPRDKKKKVKCEGSGAAVVSFNPTLTANHGVHVVLNKFLEPKTTVAADGTKTTAPADPGQAATEKDLNKRDASWLAWDIELSLVLSMNPSVKVEGTYECALDLPNIEVQVTSIPVPIHLEVEPKIGASSTATFEISGPKVDLTLGFESKGWLAVVDNPGWFTGDHIEYPGYDPKKKAADQKIDDTKLYAKPIRQLDVGKATADVSGTLNATLGAEARLGVGTKSFWGGAKAGFAFNFVPANATITANSTSACADLSLGASLEVDALLEAWFLFPSWSLEERFPIYKGSVGYPNANWKLGTCPEGD